MEEGVVTPDTNIRDTRLRKCWRDHHDVHYGERDYLRAFHGNMYVHITLNVRTVNSFAWSLYRCGWVNGSEGQPPYPGQIIYQILIQLASHFWSGYTYHQQYWPQLTHIPPNTEYLPRLPPSSAKGIVLWTSRTLGSGDASLQSSYIGLRVVERHHLSRGEREGMLNAIFCALEQTSHDTSMITGACLNGVAP